MLIGGLFYLGLAAEITKQRKAARIRAYLNVIAKANKKKLMEALKMYNPELSLQKTMEEVGLAAIWEARGEAKVKAEIARNMLREGFSPEQTAKLSGLGIKKVKALSKTL